MNEKIDWGKFIAGTTPSIQRRLQNELENIEDARRKGYSHQEILAHLNENGFSLTMVSYRTMLKRARKRCVINKMGEALPVKKISVVSENISKNKLNSTQHHTDSPKKLVYITGSAPEW